MTSTFYRVAASKVLTYRDDTYLWNCMEWSAQDNKLIVLKESFLQKYLQDKC